MKKVVMALLLVLVIGAMLGLGGCIINNDGVSSPPAGATEVSAEELQIFLWETFPYTNNYHVPDSVYFLSGFVDLERFLIADNLNYYQYHDEWFDCDEFSVALKGRAAEKGIALAIVDIYEYTEEGYEGHQLNLFVTKEEGKLKAYFVEPQSDEVWLAKNEECKMVSLIIF